MAIKEKLQDIPRLGNTLYYLGEVHFYQDNLSIAKQFFLKTSEVADACGEILYAAKANFYLAKIARGANELQNAQKFAKKCLSTFQYLGMEKEYQDVSEFISKNRSQ